MALGDSPGAIAIKNRDLLWWWDIFALLGSITSWFSLGEGVAVVEVGAVLVAIWVGEVAGWEVWLSVGWATLGEGLLVVEFLYLHGDVLAEVLVTVHAGGEKFDVGWAAGDVVSVQTGLDASGDLEESGSGW